MSDLHQISCEFYIDLWEIVSLVYVKVPLGPPNKCSRISVLLCGLVPGCGYAVIRRSTWYRHGFSASLPVAWLHPAMAGIKLVISVVFHHLPLFVPTAVKIGPPTGLSLSARLRHWPLSSRHPTPLVERRSLCHHLFGDRVDIITVSIPLS
jgi:hypothetical protein